MNNRPTPETDALMRRIIRTPTQGYPLARFLEEWGELCIKLERERDEAREALADYKKAHAEAESGREHLRSLRARVIQELGEKLIRLLQRVEADQKRHDADPCSCIKCDAGIAIEDIRAAIEAAKGAK